MRLDHFMPFPARPRKGQAPRQRSRLYRLIARALPKSWTSQATPRKLGHVRILLRRIGASWQSSPIRRLVQSICFVTFLTLFFYVCWPYRANPEQIHSGWIPAEVDIAEEQITLVCDGDIPEEIRSGAKLHFYDTSQTGSPYMGEFSISEKTTEHLIAKPITPLSPSALEELSFSLGPWTLSPHPPDHWPSHYADTFESEDSLPAEIFLILDPLVSLSTAAANKSWVWSLTAAIAILLACIFIPRGFCGYLCPLGTLIDLFDWAIGKRVKRFRVGPNGWWVHIKYYLLATIFVAAAFGVLLSGFFAAIPVITRGLLYTLAPLQDGFIRGWHQVPAMNSGQYFSIALFLGVLCLGFFQPRFWCKYVCPSGAVFSLGNLFRVSERKVESSCINCNKCVEICPFDAIKPDFTTRTTDCTLCQSCGGVCPTHAIKFVERWDITNLKTINEPPTGDTLMGRRSFLASALGGVTGVVAGTGSALAVKSSNVLASANKLPVRPPGSVPEPDFLELCIRCGECFKVCPNNVLQSEGFKQGWEGLWTPEVVADWAGCEPSCHSCGQVCPTGSIRALPLEEKRHARMGLAILNEKTCLPLAGEEACQLCVDECTAAGYDAIEFIRVHSQIDDAGRPVPASGFLAPQVRAEACVGCGLCQTRCYSVNAKDKGLLKESAIVIETGPEREDRILTGSYIELAQQRKAQKKPNPTESGQNEPEYLPDFLDSLNSKDSNQ
jgi:ferredoxin